MRPFTKEVLDHLEANHGIASRAQLEAAGLSSHTVRRMVDAGNLVEVLKGVYRMPAVPFDELARCAAVCAGHPGVAISGPTAGRLWGIRRLPRDHRVHVLSTPASHPTIAPWVVPYRTAAVHPDDFVVRRDGIVITSRARTALDLTRTVDRRDLRSIIEQAMHDGSLDEDDIRLVAVDWISRGRPWIRRFLEVLGDRVGGGAAESHGEVIVGDALARAGMRGLERQYRIDLPGYGPARFDLAVPRRRLAIEVDLFPTHRETAGRRRDAWRDAAAAEIGWAIERVTDADLGPNLSATVRRLVQAASSMR